MVEAQKSQDKEEKVVFSKQIIIQLYEVVEGESITLNDRSFEDILKSIKRKIDILSDLRRDETYEALKKEILGDIAHLVYKLEQGENA